jgi:hypothetical protein
MNFAGIINANTENIPESGILTFLFSQHRIRAAADER